MLRIEYKNNTYLLRQTFRKSQKPTKKVYGDN